MLEHGGIGRHANLATAEFARDMHHFRQVVERMTAAGHQQRLVGHQQAVRALLAQGDGSGQMRMDALAPDGEIGELLLHRLLLVEAGLLGVPQCRADDEIGIGQGALHEGESRITVQRLTDIGGGPGVLVEQHVLPGDQHIVEDHDGVDFVELVRQRIVSRRRPPREAGAADVFHARCIHLDDATQRIFRELGISPIGDGGF